MEKKFKLRKGQEKNEILQKVLDVRHTMTHKGTTTLKHMCAIRDAVKKNLNEIENDIELAEKALGI